MDPFERSERQRAARYRQRAQQARRSRLQGRVVVASLICFALLWGIVFTQMATGNDPVLSAKRTQVAQPHKQATRPAPEEEAVPIEEEAAPEEEFPVEEEVPVEEVEEAPVEEIPAEEAAPVEEEEFAPEPEAVVTGQS